MARHPLFDPVPPQLGRPVGVDQIFTHTDTDPDSTVRHFSITLLRASIAQNPGLWELATLPIGLADAEFMIGAHGVDLDRVHSLSVNLLHEPGIACQFPEGSLLIVDGNHRLVRRVHMGLPTMSFWVAPEPVWRHCLADPADLLKIR